MMNRRTLLSTAGAVALARPALAQPANARILRFIPQSDVTILDPVVTTAYITRTHALLVWDQLYGVDAQFRPQPQMAEGHVVEQDGKLWTFRLREGLRFHDGEPVRGRDCVASIQRWAQRDPIGQALLARMAEMTAPDDRSFTIRLHRPFGALLDALAKVGPPAMLVMPERLAMTDPARQIPEIIGSGPWRFVPQERVVGARAVYQRFEGYKPRPQGAPEWMSGPKVAHFDRVEWTVMPDPGTSLAAMRNNEMDWWENPPNDLLPPMLRDRNLHVRRVNPMGALGTGVFNHLHPPFNNLQVRRAVLQAMRQEDYMTALAGTDRANWRAGIGVFTPETPMANAVGLELLPGDMALARRTLAASGYANEKTVLLFATDTPVQMALGEVTVDLLRRLGLNLEIATSDWGTVVQRRASTEPVEKGGWSMYQTSWNGVDMVNPIATQVLRANGRRAFFGWPDVPEMEALRDQWIEADDPATQRALAERIQRLALEHAVFMPTGQYFNQAVHRREIEGVVTGQQVFWNARRV